MTANTFGKTFSLTTFGESHGDFIGCVVDGCPAGLALTEFDIQQELDRRKPGTSKLTSQRREEDIVTIISGMFEGETTGAPIAMLIKNTEQRNADYENLKNVFRPGHADYTYFKKYGRRDYRGGGRSSARETAMRVAAGAIAKKYLAEKCGILIRGCMDQIGEIKAEQIDWTVVNHNPLFFPDQTKLSDIEQYIDELRRAGDSVGARICVQAERVPIGLGDPVYNKLDATIASAMMSINAVKGVEIGAGFESVTQKGSEHRDEITPEGFLSNHSGGVLGGISTGQDILVRIAIKPTSSIRIPAKTIDLEGNATMVSVTGRHDPCIGIRAVPVAEAMMAIVLMDFVVGTSSDKHF